MTALSTCTTTSERPVPTSRRQSRWRDPESASRLVVLLGSWTVLGILAAAGILTTVNALGWATTGMFFFGWWQYFVEHKARRDLTADLAQQIHDGRVSASDLRRSRGYWQVEERLEHADARPETSSPEGSDPEV